MYLNCHTGFSFKYGTLPIKTLFNEAKRCGIHKLALTEINNVSSYLEMLRICDENKLRAHEFIGVRSDELNVFSADSSRKDYMHKFVALHPVTFLPPEKVEDKKT